MERLKDIFLSALCITVLIGYAENLVIDRFRRYVKLVSGLLIVVLLASPLIETLYRFADELLPEYKEEDAVGSVRDYSAYIGVFKETLRLSVVDYITENTELEKEDFTVEIFLNCEDSENIIIELIKVSVKGEKVTVLTENMIKALYGCDAEIVYVDNEDH